jgi:hypothetical protein
MSRLLRRAAIGALVAAVMTGGQAVASTAANADSSRGESAPQTVQITSNAAGMHFSTSRVHEGPIRFRISTTSSNGLDVVLFQLHRGVSFARLTADLTETNAAKSTRDLVRDVTFYGLAAAQPGTPVTSTVTLEDGTYYAFDVSSQTETLPTAKNVTRLYVREGGNEHAKLGDDLATISTTSSDRFVVRGHLPDHGSVLVKNTSDTIHFMEVLPVTAGTTDAQVQAYLETGSNNPPPFARRAPGITMELLSPHKQQVLTYSLPEGTYVLLCFVADDVTGMPHALMGMHKVVHLG